MKTEKEIQKLLTDLLSGSRLEGNSVVLKDGERIEPPKGFHVKLDCVAKDHCQSNSETLRKNKS